MKTTTRSLLFIALASATGSAAAQDAHAGHHGHGAPAKPDPHAGHASAIPAKAAEKDPHAGHAGPGGTATADDPHAGHDTQAGTSGRSGMPADHAAHMDHASHAAPQPVDPHAGHAPATAAKAVEKDPHAGHVGPGGTTMADNPHAGQGTPAGHAAHMDHASHATPQPVDPHAGHAVETPASEPAHSHDAHAGHAMHGVHMPAKATAPSDAGTHGAHGAHDEHAGHGAAAMQAPREPIPEPTAADLAAAFPTLAPHAMEHAPGFNSLVLFDHLEAWNNAHGSGQSWAAKGWFGGDIDRLWLRSEGQRSEGRLGGWSLDALYGHAISPWWDVVGGVRHDGGDAAGLTRAAIGVQGLAPYKFEFAATAYLGGPRRAELAVEAEYSLLLSNRLILQPSLAASLAADSDPHRGVGSGLGHVEAGLRLRYEITRRFAPYVGFVHERRFGRTAGLHRDAGESPRDSRWVAGVRFWF